MGSGRFLISLSRALLQLVANIHGPVTAVMHSGYLKLIFAVSSVQSIATSEAQETATQRSSQWVKVQVLSVGRVRQPEQVCALVSKANPAEHSEEEDSNDQSSPTGGEDHIRVVNHAPP